MAENADVMKALEDEAHYLHDTEIRRKRDYPSGENDENRVDQDYAEHESHDYKRRRSSNWPLPKDPLPDLSTNPPSSRKHRSPASSASRRHGKVLIRSSRFQEGSMRDRPSDKPPSVFTRVFGGNNDHGTMDRLMDDYHEDSVRPAVAKGRRDLSPSKRLTHHSNPSSTSNATNGSRESGIYRFGRSLASSFNPANIWRSVANNWNAAREEIIQEETERQMKEMDDRKAKAEAAYAELKKAGQLHAQGSYDMETVAAVFASTSQNEGAQRDSGVHMDDVRSSIEDHQPMETIPSPRKSSFKFRSPSFTNLKKVKSEVQLGSPEVDQHELRKVQSKKDLQKRQKLVKRVSDLEAKLDDAKRELSRALGDAPPVPALPKSISSTNLAPAKPASGGSPPPPPLQKRKFVPGELPTLPSERLLFPEQLRGQNEDEEMDEVASTPPEDNTPFDNFEMSVAAEGPVDVPEPPSRPAPAPPRAKVTKKRKSGNDEDIRYRPDTDNDDDAEWEEAAKPVKVVKKKKSGTVRLTKKREAVGSGSSPHRKPSGRKSLAQDATQEVTIPLKDAPSKPTAFATPAHPRGSSYGVRSSSGHRLTKKRSFSQKRSGTPRSRDSRSPSMPSEGEEAIHLVPDGVRIPPLPVLPGGTKAQRTQRTQNVKDDFEWPDDVF